VCLDLRQDLVGAGLGPCATLDGAQVELQLRDSRVNDGIPFP
jgi:hypothetical protein